MEIVNWLGAAFTLERRISVVLVCWYKPPLNAQGINDNSSYPFLASWFQRINHERIGRKMWLGASMSPRSKTINISILYLGCSILLELLWLTIWFKFSFSGKKRHREISHLGYLGLSSFSGCGMFSAKTEEVWGKPEWTGCSLVGCSSGERESLNY